MKLRLLALTSALALPVLLTGCVKPTVVTAEELCRSWRHQTISKDDRLTDKTASGIEGSNNARPAWGCIRGKDEAVKKG